MKTSMLRDKDTFDATYAERYTERNRIKVEKILQALDHPASVLDLGCNAGYVDAAVLDRFPQARCHGVELEQSVVDPQLLANDRFTLTVSDVVDFRFEQTYDAVIFNAVLHHVLGKYGKETAFRLWTDIVDHTNCELFFETGIAEEHGDYYWKDAILREFGGDELYYSELIRRIGPRLKRMDVVAELPIHRAVRLLHRFELHPLGSEHDLKSSPDRIYADAYLNDDRLQPIEEYRRTEGSAGQRLIPADSSSENVFQSTRFFKLRNTATDELLFAKQILNDPLKQMREFQIHQQVEHPRLLNCLGVSKNHGLVFPWYEAVPLPQIDWPTVENKDEVAKQIEDFFHEANKLRFQPGELDIDPLASVAARTVAETVDLHANNILVQVAGQRVTDWRVIDLEHYTNSNGERNQRHLQSILQTILRPKKGWLSRLGLRK